jgi:hypothetical protein
MIESSCMGSKIVIDKNDPFYRICPHCGKEFITSHSNRNFCPPPSREEKLKGMRDCKITYNNLKAKKLRDVTKEVYYSGINNMKILESYYANNITIISGDELFKRGFDPGKATDRMMDANGKNTIPVYYKYKLLNLGNDTFKIEKI